MGDCVDDSRIGRVSIGQAAKRFDDTFDKRYKLMKRWDKFPPMQPVVGWKDEFDLTSSGGIADDSRIV